MSELQKYQDKLIELLDSEKSPSEISRQLAEDPDCSMYKSYIESFDDRMIAIGQELVKKWAQWTERP